MNKYILSLSSGSIGVIAGLLLTASLKGNIGDVLIGISVGAVPTGWLTYVITESRYQSKLNDSESKFSSCKSKSDSIELSFKEVQSKFDEVSANYRVLFEQYQALKTDKAKDKLELKKLDSVVSELSTAKNQIRELLEIKEQYEIDWQSMEENQEQLIANEVKRRLRESQRNEIQQIWEEADKHCQNFMKDMDVATELMLAFKDRADGSKSIALSLGESACKFRDEKNRQIDNLLEQLELKNARIGILQQKLEGDLIEPECINCGFDQNGRIVNAIAQYLWNHHQIPLKVAGYDIGSDGIITAGYLYSRSMAPETLVRVIESESSQMPKIIGVYAIEKPQKLQIADVFTVKIRRERPARKADKGSLYRSKEEFVNYILSQPLRLRLIGEPGAGKTPTVAVLLSHILKRGFLNANTPNGQKLPYSIVESCNPLAGISVKNGNELDFCLKWNSGTKGFKGLVEEYRFRKNPANTEYKNQVGYIWIADEVDNTMAELTKDEAKPFKDALKDGGHVNLGVIVMGQSANVSTSKGLSIDDQKMMINIYIDPVSIRTFLTQYGERFYSKKAVEKALSTLEELELEIEEQNEIICDTAREFRIGMVTANRSPVFYQLPYFDSVDINLENYQKALTEIAHIRATRRQLGATTDSIEDLSDKDCASRDAGASAAPTQVLCPKCASTVKRNGKTVTGVQKYRCKNSDCNNGFTL